MLSIEFNVQDFESASISLAAVSELLISAEIKLGSVPRSMANGVRKIGVPIPKPVVSTVFTDLAGISS